MVPLARVVVDDVQDHLQPGRVQRPDQLPELGVLIAHLASVRVSVVRREETDRVVAPVVTLPGVKLKHGHQLHHGHAQLDEVRDLVDQAREGPASVIGQSRTRVRREAADVELVDHGIGLVPAPAVVTPVERLPVSRDQAQGRPAGIRARPDRRLPVEASREMEGARVGIEQDLVRVEAMMRLARSVDLIGVEARALHLRRRDAAVPDGTGLVRKVVQPPSEDRVGGILLSVEEQRHAFGVLGVDGEVPGLLLGDPRRPERERQPFEPRPGGGHAPGRGGGHGVASRGAAVVSAGASANSRRSPAASSWTVSRTPIRIDGIGQRAAFTSSA